MPWLTAIGELVRRVPLHPRLARMMVAAGGARQVARACALLSERHLLPPRAATTTSDLLSALDRWEEVPPHVKRIADEIADFRMQISDSGPPNQPELGNQPSAISSEASFRRAILAGYPDRVAQRREPGSANVRLASGTGAIIAPESGVRDGEFLVALDVHANVARGFQPSGRQRIGGPERAAPRVPLVRIASRVEREWLEPTSSEIVHRFDKESGKVRAFAVDRYDALVLVERPAAADPEIAAALLAGSWIDRGPRDEDTRLLRRLRFAGHDPDVGTLVRTAAYGARTLEDVRIDRAL